MPFFLGIDLGTSYFKAGVFDGHGKLMGLGRCFVRKEAGAGRLCELDVPVFFDTLSSCIREALQKADVRATEIKAVSYSSQANSFVLLDKYDAYLTPIILWPDQRVEELPVSVQTLIDSPDFNENTGIGVKPGSQSLIAKVEWYKLKRPDIWKKVRRIMSISDYLTFILTGCRISDYSTSSMTGLFSISGQKWWDKALMILNMDKGCLSSPACTGSLAGRITGKGAELTGLAKGTLFVLGGLDHHMVAVSAGFPDTECISESTGTVLACVSYEKGLKYRAGLNVASGLSDNFYFNLAFDTNGALPLEWYQRNYSPESSVIELLALAENVAVGSDGLIAQPCANMFGGLNGFDNRTANHSRAHFVRAILESTALSLLKLVKTVDPMESVQIVIPSGGGARSHLWMQIKADMLNKTFSVPECSELACQGAAMTSFIGSSELQDISGVIDEWRMFKKTIVPDPDNVEKYKDWRNRNCNFKKYR